MAAIVCVLASSRAEAAPKSLDRIVAVVDQQIITMSEVRTRVRPLMRQLTDTNGKLPTDVQIAGITKDMLERIIEERLVALAAEERHLTVTNQEIDQGVVSVAGNVQLTPDALYETVEHLGMSRQDYRDEIRRQLLEGKWMQLSLRARVTMKPDDKDYAMALQAERDKELTRLRAIHYVEVRS